MLCCFLSPQPMVGADSRPALVARDGKVTSRFLKANDGNELDSGQWLMAHPIRDSSVSITDGRIALRNRGRLVTKHPFPFPVEVSGQFTFTENPNEQFMIITRASEQGDPAAKESR